MNRLLCATLTALLVCGSMAQAAEPRKDRIQLAENHPTQYTVVKGDTLWGIAGRFLKSPWKWPDVWEVNPQIDNPNLIYPGDIVYLTWVNGKPHLGLRRGRPKLVKLSPTAKRIPLAESIPTIPLRDISAFLKDNIVVEDDVLQSAPYIIASDQRRLVSGEGDRVYARGDRPAMSDNTYQMNIYRPAKPYYDPNTKELLGYELYKVGEGPMTAYDPDTQVLTLRLTRSDEEVRNDDRVMPAPEGQISAQFFPSSAPDLQGVEILSVLGGVDSIGQFDSVALNAGERDGVKVGNVFAVYRTGEAVRDTKTGDIVNLPSERAGELMVFKTFDRVSYGIIMRATSVLGVGDKLEAP